ncbi:MAG: hypothetical protein AAEI08_02305 [Gammaproteobacteria bacterium]
MKNAIRLNSRENRVVYVSKPHMDDRSNKVALLEMGKSDMLGLETLTSTSRQNQRPVDTRNFYIRKPRRLESDPNSAMSLKEGATIVLDFNTSISKDATTEYYDLIAHLESLTR